jgi:hypothetical protein
MELKEKIIKLTDAQAKLLYIIKILYEKMMFFKLDCDMFIVFIVTFNNISVILWWTVLLVEETGKNLSFIRGIIVLIVMVVIKSC